MQARAGRGDHEGGGCVCVQMTVYVWLTCASEESAPHLISILNECVLFLSDASCPPQAPISRVEGTCVCVHEQRQCTSMVCLKVSFEISGKTAM